MSNPLVNLVYIFQSEHYDRMRFFRFVYKNLNWFSFSVRGKLDWTIRARLIFILSLLLYAADVLAFFWVTGNMFFTSITVLIGYFFLPIYSIAADFLISPLVFWKKKKITQRARKIVDESGVKVVAMTGSYGKTTMKIILQSLLQEQFSVLVLPGNINTDLGVANYLLHHADQLASADILIVEMGAYKIGEINNICAVTPPHYSILTAVAPVHLERFGSIENIMKAKWEIVENTREKAFVNIDNTNIQSQIAHYKLDSASSVTSVTESSIVPVHMNGADIQYSYLADFNGIAFEYSGDQYETKLIAHHVLGMISLAIDLASELGMKTESIQKGIQNIPAVPHRLEVIKNEQTGVTVIDDSYNGNFDGFISALKTLSRATGRRVVLTPGIVELGEMQEQVHRDLAKAYIAEKLDVVLLISNSNTDFIVEEFDLHGFRDYKIYLDVFASHNDLKNILKKGDTILFQNDLSDSYR